MSLPTNSTTSPSLFYCQSHIGRLGRPWKNAYLTNGTSTNLVLSVAFNSIIIPFTVCLNGLLIFIITREHALKKIHFIAIRYLAVTDLAVGLIVQPIFVSTELCRITGHCKLCTLESAFWTSVVITCGSSIHHIVLIACERFVAIKYALRHEVIVTRKRLMVGSVTAWLVAVTFEGIILLDVSPFVPHIIGTVDFCICFALLIYFSTSNYLKSKVHRRAIEALVPHSQQGMALPSKHKFRAAKTTTIIIGCFLICHAPVVVVTVINFLGFLVNVSESSMLAGINSWQCTFFMFNSFVNPLIYGWRVRKIREYLNITFISGMNRSKPKVKSDITVMVEMRKNPAIRHRGRKEETKNDGH